MVAMFKSRFDDPDTLAFECDRDGSFGGILENPEYSITYSYTSLGYTNQMLDGTTGTSLWTANFFDAEGHVTNQTTGDGLVTLRAFDSKTGRLTSIRTAPPRNISSNPHIQNLNYTYGLLGNLQSRSDADTNMSETLAYDALNRLTSSSISGSTSLSKAFSYDPIGNMLSKSDVGTYSYPAAGSPRPHG